MKRGDSPFPPWALPVLLGLALALRLVPIAWIGPDADELFQAYTAVKPASLSEWFAMARGNPHHVLLDPFLSWLLARVSGSLFWLRLPSVLLGTLEVFLLFRLGRRIANPRTGLLAAGLLAFSMLHVEWSRRANFYSALGVWTLLSADLLLSAVERPGFRAFLPLAAVQAGFALTHPYALLVAGLQGLWILGFRRGRLWPFLAAQGLAFLAYLPWHWAAGSELLAGRAFEWSERFGWHPGRYLLETLLSWAQAPEQSSTILPGWARSLQGLSALGYAALLVLGLGALRRDPTSKEAWALPALWVPAGWVGVLALDWSFDYFFAPRQTLLILPFYLLLVARGIDELSNGPRVQGSWRTGALLLAATLFIAPFVGSYASDLKALLNLERERNAYGEEIRRSVRPGDVFLFDDPNTTQGFLYLYDRKAFFEASPPRLHRGIYFFRLPDDLWFRWEGGKNRVYSILDPALRGEQERLRWARIAGELRGRKIIFEGQPVGLGAEKARAFFEFTGVHPQ